MKIRKSEMQRAYEEGSLSFKDKSLLKFLVEHRYIPRDYDYLSRTAYSGIIFKISKVDVSKVNLVLIYDNLRISCYAVETKDYVDIGQLKIERSNRLSTELPLGYKKLFDQSFFYYLNEVEADLKMREFIKSNFKDHVDDDFYLDSERYAKGEDYVNYAVC